MKNALYIVENALPLSLIDEIAEHANLQKLIRTNHTSWDPAVVGLSGPIYISDIEGTLKERIQAHVAGLLPDWELDTLAMTVSHNACGRYGFIPWHDDGNHLFSGTVYLNQVWDRDWAGYFLYERVGSKDVSAVLPAFNKAVFFRPPMAHCVVMPNVNAPLRRTLQMFFGKKHGN